VSSASYLSYVNITLPAFAAERRAAAPLLHAERRRKQLSIDVSCRRGAEQQTRRTPLLLSNDGTDRQTDGRTRERFIDPAPHTGRAVTIANKYTTKTNGI